MAKPNKKLLRVRDGDRHIIDNENGIGSSSCSGSGSSCASHVPVSESATFSTFNNNSLPPQYQESQRRQSVRRMCEGQQLLVTQPSKPNIIYETTSTWANDGTNNVGGSSSSYSNNNKGNIDILPNCMLDFEVKSKSSSKIPNKKNICRAVSCHKFKQGKHGFCLVHYNEFLINTGQRAFWECQSCGNRIIDSVNRCRKCRNGRRDDDGSISRKITCSDTMTITNPSLDRRNITTHHVESSVGNIIAAAHCHEKDEDGLPPKKKKMMMKKKGKNQRPPKKQPYDIDETSLDNSLDLADDDELVSRANSPFRYSYENYVTDWCTGTTTLVSNPKVVVGASLSEETNNVEKYDDDDEDEDEDDEEDDEFSFSDHPNEASAVLEHTKKRREIELHYNMQTSFSCFPKSSHWRCIKCENVNIPQSQCCNTCRYHSMNDEKKMRFSEVSLLERTRYELLNGRDFWICTHCVIAIPSITAPCGNCQRMISFIPLEIPEFEDFVRRQRRSKGMH